MSKNPSSIQEIPFDQALSERYLSYALSTIMARSLPDVRDGLKPVQRRILYAMMESGNTPDKQFRKSASGVGLVMMKYHPHGNDPIYEAMVRMAQDFSIRYPLIEGQGNFGSLDGDNPAAMRYTEARLSKVGVILLQEINEDVVDFVKTYNGETEEPVVLPTVFPNLLANGATGIAVGMATNIPPHNVGEICDALLYLVQFPEASIEDLRKYLPAPDFPTGGIIAEDGDVLSSIYHTGRGSFRLRSRYCVEELKGGMYQIVVQEIPYQIQKARLIEKIAQLIVDKKLTALSDIRDESSTDVRLVLVPRTRNMSPDVLMESLFRITDLEIRYAVNMNVLDAKHVPRVMNLKQVLQAFLDHRREVICRRSRYRLQKIDHHLEVLNGYQIAYLNLDEVIKIIRESDEPKQEMQQRWNLTEIQAEAILNMRLRALRKLEEVAIIKEIQALKTEAEGLQGLLADERKQWKNVSDQIRLVRKEHGSESVNGKRRTSLTSAPSVQVMSQDAFIEREPVTVICSEKGWIRIVKGHGIDQRDVKYKEGDQEKFILQAETPDKLLAFSSHGKMYTLAIDKLPSGRGNGEPLSMLIDLPAQEQIISVFAFKQETEDLKFLVASTEGYGFIVKAGDALAQTRTGKQILNVTQNSQALKCQIVEGDFVATVGKNRKLLIFSLHEIPQMMRGRGVILQRFKGGGLSDIITFSSEQGMLISSQDKIVKNWRLWIGKRGQTGRIVPPGFPKNNHF